MYGLISGTPTMHGLVRSAIMLSAALLLLSIAAPQPGLDGPLGVVVAGLICLFSGLVAAATASLVSQASPLSGALVGMMVRMFVPMAVVVAILAAGENGRDHAYFIGYLLAFYMVMLGLATWLAVKRVSGPRSGSDQNTR
jgi:hypothetical protein